MKYFQRFPTVNYDTSGDGVLTTMTDITPNFKVRNANLVKNTSYMYHLIGDGERPDVTSHMLYGTTAYHWTFFVINDHLRKGITQWPLSQSELDTYVASKYNDYAVITFDPTSSGTNLSYVPLDERYLDSLYLSIDTVDGVAYRKIVHYDTASCQMVVERNAPTAVLPDANDITINRFIGSNSYRISSFLFDSEGNVTGVNQDFIDAVNASYGLGEGEDSSQYYYEIAKDPNGNDLCYELMKNAPYQFYHYINDEPTTLSTYDVISQDMIFPNVNRITYEEMEETVNTQKKTIAVINPANIAKFAQSYFTVQNDG